MRLAIQQVEKEFLQGFATGPGLGREHAAGGFRDAANLESDHEGILPLTVSGMGWSQTVSQTFAHTIILSIRAEPVEGRPSRRSGRIDWRSSSQLGRGRRPKTLVESARPHIVAAVRSPQLTSPDARATYQGSGPFTLPAP